MISINPNVYKFQFQLFLFQFAFLSFLIFLSQFCCFCFFCRALPSTVPHFPAGVKPPAALAAAAVQRAVPGAMAAPAASSAKRAGVPTEFNGKVSEIVNGSSIRVEYNGEPQQVTFSSVRAVQMPRPQNRRKKSATDDDDDDDDDDSAQSNEKAMSPTRQVGGSLQRGVLLPLLRLVCCSPLARARKRLFFETGLL